MNHDPNGAIAAGPATSAVRGLSLATINDDHDALRFRQRSGFPLVDSRSGAMANGRRPKPAFPEIGDFNIPMGDELRLIGRITPG